MPSRKSFVLRDAVHGDIYLTTEERRILDTPEMQRLRGIKQLASADLVYPCARHTRFEHSIGTLHMAQQMIDAINRNAEQEPARCLGIGPEEARIVRASALLHDITHIPFGHNIEDQTRLFERHDTAPRFQAMLGLSTGVGRVLSELRLRDEVLAILCPEGTPGLPAVPASWRQIVSDTICSDILDYLARDAYFTGLDLTYDRRIINYFKIDRATQKLYIDCVKRGQLREDVVSEIVRMLEARYYFSERVYYHHAKVLAGAVIAKAAEHAVTSGALKAEDFFHLSDEMAVERLANARYEDPQIRRRVQRLMEGFRRRELLKRVCVYSYAENREIQAELVELYFTTKGLEARAQKEAEIAELVRMATGAEVEIVLYCPAKKMQLKEAQTHVSWPGQGTLEPLSNYAESIPRLSDLERSYRNLWKFYVLASTRDRAVLRQIQRICAQVFPRAKNAYEIPS
ncbi:MAG: HD domain-containing protein [Planctomycetes bacterium]|nr:HD domain-containing protein [Planctomycetota bacterium]